MTRGEFDTCVVGSGAAGSVVAARLANAGEWVVVVEQGDHVAPGTHLHDLIPNFETATARNPDGTWTEAGYPWTACAVGGGTRFYAGVSLRLRPVDLAPGGRLAADALPVEWPFETAHLEEHYTAVERLIGLSVSSAGPDNAAPGRLPRTAQGHRLAAAAQQCGMHVIDVPLAVNTDPATAVVCTGLTPCTDWVCPSGAKNDAYLRVLAPAMRTGSVELLVRHKALRLVETRGGVVEELHCIDLARGSEVRVRASRFVVAANAVQSAALLLRSRSQFSPDGIGNEHDMVGRGLCFKVGQNTWGRLPEPHGGNPSGGRYSSIAIDSFYVDDSFPGGLGGLLLETSELNRRRRREGRVLRLDCLLADQPRRRNRVRLDWSRLDRYGCHRLVLDYLVHPVDRLRLDRLLDPAQRLLLAAGAQEIKREPLDFTLGSAHLHGTCRMGRDPVTSVCDGTGRVHSMQNVFVADGALMPFPGAVNPTLTIQALAHRTAQLMITASAEEGYDDDPCPARG